MFETVLDREKDEFDCKAPGCQQESVRSMSFSEIGTWWFCDKHWRTAKRYKQRSDMERYCEGPECILRLDGSIPVGQKYCSDHCKQSAHRVRNGLPPLQAQGPYSGEEEIIRMARREIDSLGLKPLPLYDRESKLYRDAERQYGPGQKWNDNQIV